MEIDTVNAMSVQRGDGPLHLNYGYLWWIMTVQTSETMSVDVLAALGHGGQMIFILKPYNIVVVSTAWEMNFYPAIDILLDVIIPSIQYGGGDASGPDGEV